MKKLISLLLALTMVLSIGAAAFAGEEPDGTEPATAGEESAVEPAAAGELPSDRNCEHTYSYRVQADSYEATDTEGGYRHYICGECGAEYAYYTDPMVYADGFVKQDGTVVEVNETNEGVVNPYLPLWEHIPDGEPHVFWSREDLEWRFYIFGDHDVNGVICGDDQVLWSAPVYDMSDWRYEGEILRIYESEESEDGQGESAGGGQGESADGESDGESAEGESEGESEEGESDGESDGVSIADLDFVNMGKLFAPDCGYDVNTDAFYMVDYDNSVSLCNVYRATRANANYGDLNDIVFTITLGTPNVEEGLYSGSDPAILFENGIMYMCTNSSAVIAEMQGDPEITAEVEEYKSNITESGPGRISIQILYKVEEIDGKWTVTDYSYCPIAGSQYHFFPMEEASSLRKDEATGYYILVYNGGGGTRADGVKHQTTGMSYAYTTDLMGEWHYGENGFGDDVIHDNHGHYLRDANGDMQLTDKETMGTNNDNNHGGLVKINGKWYITGHIRTSNGCRQGVAEKVELVYEDGELFIAATENTSTGIGADLDAYAVCDAGISCYRTPAGSVKTMGYMGNHRVDAPPEIDFDVTHYAPMTGLVDGAVIGYKYLDFGDGDVEAGAGAGVGEAGDAGNGGFGNGEAGVDDVANDEAGEGNDANSASSTGLKILVRQEDGYTDGSVEIYMDAPSAEEGGTKLGTVVISADAIETAAEKEEGTDGTVWSWLSTDLEQAVSGRHGIYYIFHADTEETPACLLDQFRFIRQ